MVRITNNCQQLHLKICAIYNVSQQKATVTRECPIQGEGKAWNDLLP
jgi:hypothetical protein